MSFATMRNYCERGTRGIDFSKIKPFVDAATAEKYPVAQRFLNEWNAAPTDKGAVAALRRLKHALGDAGFDGIDWKRVEQNGRRGIFFTASLWLSQHGVALVYGEPRPRLRLSGFGVNVDSMGFELWAGLPKGDRMPDGTTVFSGPAPISTSGVQMMFLDISAVVRDTSKRVMEARQPGSVCFEPAMWGFYDHPHDNLETAAVAFLKSMQTHAFSVAMLTHNQPCTEDAFMHLISSRLRSSALHQAAHILYDEGKAFVPGKDNAWMEVSERRAFLAQLAYGDIHLGLCRLGHGHLVDSQVSVRLLLDLLKQLSDTIVINGSVSDFKASLSHFGPFDLNVIGRVARQLFLREVLPTITQDSALEAIAVSPLLKPAQLQLVRALTNA